MYVVYILKSLRLPKIYIGSTNNIKRRIKEHNYGKSAYTKRHKPWKIMYAEKYNTMKEARLREKYLKGRSGRRWIKEKFFN